MVGKVEIYISRVASWEASRENIVRVVSVGKENGPKTKSNVKQPKKKKKTKNKRLTVVVQRWLTQGEKSDENMQPILWTERRTGEPASAGKRKQLAF
jgi:hypothetical protein